MALNCEFANGSLFSPRRTFPCHSRSRRGTRPASDLPISRAHRLDLLYPLSAIVMNAPRIARVNAMIASGMFNGIGIASGNGNGRIHPGNGYHRIVTGGIGSIHWHEGTLIGIHGRDITVTQMKAATSIPPPNPRGTSNSNYHEAPLNSTTRFPYRIRADRAEETDAARARTVRFT